MHAVLIIMNGMKTILGHMFCPLGTLQNLRIQCEHVGYPHVAPVAAVQRPEMYDKTLFSMTYIEFLLNRTIITVYFCYYQEANRMPISFRFFIKRI